MPSPQRGIGKHLPGLGQDQPLSARQPVVQPKPAIGGSHCSPASITLLPQVEPPPTSGEKLSQPGKQPSTPGGSQISPGSTCESPHSIVDAQTLASPSWSS